jgi:DNA-directed RNA polymerase I, II, and III subunit RPABC5
MIPPVRCFTCNGLISSKWYAVHDMIRNGKREADAMHEHNIHRYCCRRMILTSVDLSSIIQSPYLGLDAERENMEFSAFVEKERTVSTD